MAGASEQLTAKIGEIGEWLGSGSLNFFGLQFAGKDEQAKRLAPSLNAVVLSGGVILRNSVIPSHVQAAMDRGEQAPSDEYARIVLPFLSRPEFKGRPLLLSAVGRMVGEEVGVLEATEAAGHTIKAVPYFEITPEESFRRMERSPDRGLPDDTPAGLAKRHEEFEAKTVPLLARYERMGLLVAVDAMQPMDMVYANMVHLLHEKAMAD